VFNTATPNHKGQGKGNNRLTQLQTIFRYLQNHIATASMVSAATGIPQKCITRYKRDLEQAGRLWEVSRTNCKQTGFKAYYLTTDHNKATNRQTQLTLF
jgi:predicted transcriptional regulator